MVDLKYPHLRFACVPQRYVMAVECYLLLMACYMLRYSISFALPLMTRVANAAVGHACPFKNKKDEKDESEKVYEFNWTADQQGTIHGGFFYGYVTTQLVGGILSDVFNHKVIIMSGFVTTIVLVVLQPAAARLFDYIGLTVVRVCIGLVQGLVYNSMFAATAHWVPAKERAVLSSLIFTGIHCGSVVNGWLTGYLLKHFEWDLCFYIYGIYSSFIATFFCFTTYTYPGQYPGFSPKEQAIFDEHRKHIEHNIAVRKTIPFKLIFTNIHVWGIFLSIIGEDWALVTFVVYLPSYLKRVQHVPIDEVGFYSGLAFLLLWVYAMTAAPIADYVIKKKYISVTWTRKLLYLVGTLGCGVGYMLIAFAECNTIMSLLGIVVGYPMLGLFYPSVKTNAMDLSPNYAGTIGSFGNFGGCLSGAIVPKLYGWMTENNSIAEWRLIFLISGGMIIVSGIIFLLLGSGEVQPFDSHAMEQPAQ